MPIIKLDAIDSTNDFLKRAVRENELEDYTVVIANKQTNGKGQMGAKWESDAGNNIIMSVLVKSVSLSTSSVFDLNVAVSLAVLYSLKMLHIPDVSIKWPNDIMAGSKKVCGILIENIFNSDGGFTSIVGIGLNLNQTHFENLPKATSLKNISGKSFEIDDTALLLVESIKKQIELLSVSVDELWEEYDKNLFYKNRQVKFFDSLGNYFEGKIVSVTRTGLLDVLHLNGDIKSYEVKALTMMF